jgi:ketosteroid isomerase-like protein
MIERMRKIAQQVANGNMEALYDAMSDDVVYRLTSPPNAPWAGTSHGKDQIRAALTHNLVDWKAFQVIDVFGSGERYAMLLHEHYVVKSTGKHVEHDNIVLWRIKDGRIVEVDEFGDSAHVQAAFQ